MKYLIILLVPLLMSMTQIKVFNKRTGNLVAGDAGKSITIDSLRLKMLQKNIDITDSKYRIVTADVTEEFEEEQQLVEKKKVCRKMFKSFKESDYDIPGKKKQFIKCVALMHR